MNIARQRIFVTGAHGFLGRHVMERLKASGCRDLFSPTINELDLLDQNRVDRVFKEYKPEIIIHLAAVVGGIGANRKHPGEYFYKNVMIGVPLIHAACMAGVKKFVAIGTVCAYAKYTPVPFKEDDLWNGYPEETNAPYGLAKKMLLVQLQAYRQEYGFNGIFLLPVNLYGPGDNFDPESSHVIPAMIRKFIEAKGAGEKEVILWGDGTPSREFLFVKDAADGIVLATEKYDGPQPVNLGSGNEIRISDLAGIIAKETGYTGAIRWDATMPNGQPRRCLDTSRAELLFGFRAKTFFPVGIAETVRWYREHHVE